MAIKIFHWEPNNIINEPRKKKSFGSSPELQKIIDDIAAELPDILSTDKKSAIKTKLQECKNALAELPTIKEDLEKTTTLLKVWENNKTEIFGIVEATKTAMEEKLSKETKEDVKKTLKEGITKLETLLNEISGLNLAKEELKKLIQERIDDYGWDKIADEINKKVGKDWKTVIDETTKDDFNTIKSKLLKTLAELILDYYITTSTDEPQVRLTAIDSYLSETTEKESQEASKATDRANALTRLRDKCKDLKGTITVDMKGSLKIVDEKNDADDRALAFDISGKGTSFADTAAVGKLVGINDTNKVVIYYNFVENKDEQENKFKDLKDQLNGYENRRIVFHFDKLEDKTHKLVRISGKEIHLDYSSYTKVEVSGGTKLPEIPKDWKDIHRDFEKNPLWQQNWEKGGYSWGETKEWFNADSKLHPEDFMYINWIKTVKGQNAEWYLNHDSDALTLRKEWLKYSITNKLSKYTTSGFKAEKKYNNWGSSEGHWGSDHRGKKWNEFLDKIANLEVGDKGNEFSYVEIKDGLLVALAETLLPELVTRNLAKAMRKTDIVSYLELNCSRAENNYYDRQHGVITKLNESKWGGDAPKTVRQIVNLLSY